MRQIQLLRRSSKGQVLLGGTAFLLVMVPVAVTMISILLLYVSFCTNRYYQSKVAQAAEAAAKYGVESSEWLGQAKPGYSMSTEISNVVANSLKQMGLPSASLVNAAPDPTGANLVVNLNVSGLPTTSQSAGFASVSATGTATIGVTAPPAVVCLFVPNWTAQQAGYYAACLYIPIYGHGDDTPLGPTAGSVNSYHYYYGWWGGYDDLSPVGTGPYADGF